MIIPARYDPNARRPVAPCDKSDLRIQPDHQARYQEKYTSSAAGSLETGTFSSALRYFQASRRESKQRGSPRSSRTWKRPSAVVTPTVHFVAKGAIYQRPAELALSASNRARRNVRMGRPWAFLSSCQSVMGSLQGPITKATRRSFERPSGMRQDLPTFPVGKILTMGRLRRCASTRLTRSPTHGLVTVTHGSPDTRLSDSKAEKQSG